MKTKILLLCTVVSLFLACEANRTSDFSVTEADLIGNWNLASVTMEDGTINIDLGDGNVMSENCTVVAKDMDMTFSCTIDSLKMIKVQGGLTAEIAFTFLGKRYTETEDIDSDSIPTPNYTWKLNADNTITVAHNPTLVFTIEEFDTNTLKLSARLNETRTYNGKPTTIEGAINIVLEK